MYDIRNTIAKKMNAPRQGGFTFVEVIVYTGIFVIATTLIVGILTVMIRSYSRLAAARALNTSAQTALERMVRDIRDASDASIVSEDLILVMGGTPATVTYSLDAGTVAVKEDGVPAGVLTGSTVTVTTLDFASYTTASSTAIGITLSLTATQGSVTRSEIFYTLATLRDSY
jgi:type II secretory pathway pseudopilin PulG